MATSAGTLVLAERYARALLEVTLAQHGDADTVLAELESVAALLTSHVQLADALSTPTISPDKRVAVLTQVLSGEGLATGTTKLLSLLAHRERMPLLSTIVTSYRRQLLEHKKIQPGEVTSAGPLTDDQKARLAEHLGRALDKTMELNYRTNPELVGGIVVRVGNRVFDASVVKQLQRFKEKALSSL